MLLTRTGLAWWPNMAATWSGVLPSLSTTSAERRSNVRKSSMRRGRPTLAARWRAVQPLSSAWNKLTKFNGKLHNLLRTLQESLEAQKIYWFILATKLQQQEQPPNLGQLSQHRHQLEKIVWGAMMVAQLLAVYPGPISHEFNPFALQTFLKTACRYKNFSLSENWEKKQNGGFKIYLNNAALIAPI